MLGPISAITTSPCTKSLLGVPTPLVPLPPPSTAPSTKHRRWLSFYFQSGSLFQTAVYVSEITIGFDQVADAVLEFFRLRETIVGFVVPYQ